MKQNNITIEQLNEIINTLEDCQLSNSQYDFQKLNKTLSPVLIMLKAKKLDMEKEREGIKFYAPIWVRVLLERLSNKATPLSEMEYNIFRSEVQNLTISDYKPAEPSMNGYEVQYVTPQEISEIICALKHYFKFI